MKHYAHVIARTLMALLFMLSLAFIASCTAAQTPEQVNQNPQTAGNLRVIDIVGKREWEPSEENSLICAIEGAAEGDLTYTWWAEKGSIKGEGQTVSWIAPDMLGDYSITVKVASSQGEQSAYTKKFKVTDDPYHNKTADKTIYLRLSLPSTDTVTVQSRLRSYTTAEIQCIVDGMDSSDLTYTWISPAGKLLGEGIMEGKSSKAGWIAPGQAGFYVITVIVTDQQGRQARGEALMEVLCCRDP